LKKTFLTHKTRPIAFRIGQLKKLSKGLSDLETDIDEALSSDLGRKGFVNWYLEISTVQKSIQHAIDNISSWVKKQKRDTPAVLM
jgi:hypothetical protein